MSRPRLNSFGTLDGRRVARFITALLVLGFAVGVAADEPPTASTPAAGEQSPRQAGERGVALFDGKTLAGWTPTDFGSGGDVTVKDGAVYMAAGADLTGITAAPETVKQKIPKVNYEVTLDAQRVDGSDFFCGLTFPVDDAHCTLVVGGWGGGVIGLSSLNGYDASENDTTAYQKFESGRWYAIRLRVTQQRVTAWIDDTQVVDTDIRDRTLSTRIEVAESKPFGIASWRTAAALRNLKIRKLPPQEVQAVNAELKESP